VYGPDIRARFFRNLRERKNFATSVSYKPSSRPIRQRQNALKASNLIAILKTVAQMQHISGLKPLVQMIE
jgi:hypothetical protein